MLLVLQKYFHNTTPKTNSTRYLSEQMDFKSTATQSVTTNQHPNAACSATSNERKGLTPTRLKYKLVLSDCNKVA
jgi:hypothetical protein